MLQTLPLVLFILMTEVSVGAVSVLVFLDWRNEVKRGFLISYALIYLVLAGLTYLFQQSFSSPELLNTYPQLDRAWTGYQALPLQLFFLLLIPYSFFLLLDRKAGVDGRLEAAKQEAALPETSEESAEGAAPDKAVEGKAPEKRSSLLRVLRLVSGVATVAAGLVTLFVMAMIYRHLAGNLGGAFTVAGFYAAAFALGGVLTAMWLGHWYLVTPALSERPLQFATTLVLIALVAQMVFAFAAGPASVAASPASVAANHATTIPSANAAATPIPASTPVTSPEIKPAGAPVVAPLSIGIIGWLRILVGFIMPFVLAALAWKLIRDRSFQSATGMLYLVVVCTLAGEALARGLFLAGL